MGWFESWVPKSVFSAGGGRSLVEAWFSTALDLEESLSGALDSDVHIIVADVVKSFDTVDWVFWTTCFVVWGCLGVFGMAILSIMPELDPDSSFSCGLGEAWTRCGGIPQGCPLSMVFVVPLNLPWCRYLVSFRRVTGLRLSCMLTT